MLRCDEFIRLQDIPMLTDINSDALASLFKWMNHKSDKCCIINNNKSITYSEFHNYLISASLSLKLWRIRTVILACNDQFKNLVHGIAALALGINIVPGNVNFRTAFKKLTTQDKEFFFYMNKRNYKLHCQTFTSRIFKITIIKHRT